MAEEKPSLHIDTDWKKQAQEEKRKLVDQEQQKAAAAPAAAVVAPAGPGSPGAGVGPAALGRGRREFPPASFATLVQSLTAQALYYLGDLQQGGEPVMNLDMAKHQIDTLTMLEGKTANNLSDDERRLLDGALYETRMRYVAVASQYA